MLDKTFSNQVNKADPSKFSLREEMLDLDYLDTQNKDGKDIHRYVDKNTGETFIKNSKNIAPKEKFATLLLKGVLNVSDIVEVDGKYYSHEQNFDNLESTESDFELKVTADLFILRYIFCDFDHMLLTGIDGITQTTEKRNILINTKNRRINYFDFGVVFSGTILSSKQDFTQTSLFLIDNIRAGLSRVIDQKDLEKYIQILKGKIEILIKNLNNIDIFKKILEKSKFILTEEQQENLFFNLNQRLRITKDILVKGYI